jgi:hypothetical protein
VGSSHLWCCYGKDGIVEMPPCGSDVTRSTRISVVLIMRLSFFACIPRHLHDKARLHRSVPTGFLQIDGQRHKLATPLRHLYQLDTIPHLLCATCSYIERPALPSRAEFSDGFSSTSGHARDAQSWKMYH